MFIDYNKNQLTFPLDVEVHIPEHHLSRCGSYGCRERWISLSSYHVIQVMCRPPYHPKMMLKILLYAYAKESILLEKLKNNSMKISISCGFLMKKHQTFRTINRFRSERMKDVIYETFFSLIDLLKQEGLVKLEDYFLDGTKIEG
ncbi:transposase [Bacillus pacificus]